MKKFYFVLMLLGCIGGFTACSDDDGDNGDGQGAGNGGSGVIVQPKKISQIKQIETSHDDTVTYQLDYDAQGRLFKFILNNGTSNESTTTFSYAENQITCTEKGHTSTIHLKGIYAQEEESSRDEEYKYITSFTYSGDYIATVVDQEYHKVGNNWEKDSYLFRSEFTVKDGRPEKCLDIELYQGRKDSTLTTYIYNAGVKNNTNLDLWTLVTDTEIGNFSSLLCVTGKRFTHLPSQVIVKGIDGEIYETTTLDYVVNKEGYITKVTVTSVEDEVVEPAPDPQLAASSKSYTDVTIYEITYR